MAVPPGFGEQRGHARGGRTLSHRTGDLAYGPPPVRQLDECVPDRNPRSSQQTRTVGHRDRDGASAGHTFQPTPVTVGIPAREFGPTEPSRAADSRQPRTSGTATPPPLTGAVDFESLETQPGKRLARQRQGLSVRLGAEHDEPAQAPGPDAQPARVDANVGAARAQRKLKVRRALGREPLRERARPVEVIHDRHQRVGVAERGQRAAARAGGAPGRVRRQRRRARARP